MRKTLLALATTVIAFGLIAALAVGNGNGDTYGPQLKGSASSQTAHAGKAITLPVAAIGNGHVGQYRYVLASFQRPTAESSVCSELRAEADYWYEQFVAAEATCVFTFGVSCVEAETYYVNYEQEEQDLAYAGCT